METTATDFATDVIEASRTTPVLVDFWAPWCGPCRQLGPTLEQLDAERDDWTLVKLNVDEHNNVARQYGVRGIPAVKLFVDGTVAAEFTGALPRHAVDQWLDEHLPTPEKKAIGQARTALDEGRRDDAIALLEPIVAEDASEPEANLLMSTAIVFEDPERAASLVESLDIAAPDLRQQREAVQTLSRLLTDTPDLPDTEAAATYQEALAALRDTCFDDALSQFIDVVRTDRDLDDDGARKACVALFTLLGPEHPATKAHRRAFDTSLY
ncbi:thioredoxin [Longimonas halophila]|uniref:Thioredoxin n=1 Tax=Longimonas halophila TaxID=1469170 RepID=A0A2H3NMQ0_9BACT|nr:tetratricopeptide repeat protein [Longimonas halophila]PEN06053.1 thioredoxin [Longimonas halophila]